MPTHPLVGDPVAATTGRPGPARAGRHRRPGRGWTCRRRASAAALLATSPSGGLS